MNIGFFSNDVGPSQMLGLIAKEAQDRGHTTQELFRVPPEQLPEQINDLKECEVICFSPAASTHEGERMIKAFGEEHNIPLYAIEDVPGAALRIPAEVSIKTHTVIPAYLNVEYKMELQQHGYRSVVWLGPPPHWGRSYQLVEDLIQGLRPQEMYKPQVYYMGGKDADLNNHVVSTLLGVLQEKMLLVVGFHPAESLTPEQSEKREELLKSPHACVAEDGPQELMVKSEVTVFASASTESIVGAYARIPMVMYVPQAVQDEFFRLGYPDGWFVAERGGMLKASDPQELAGAFDTLLDPEGGEVFAQSQERAFPLPESWDTASKILNFLLSHPRG